jgi:hypothetical protein
MGSGQSWAEIRRASALNEDRVTRYGRLGEIEERLCALAGRRGVSAARLAEALGVAPGDAWTVSDEDGLYVFALARHVAALGGHLELRAVFDDEQVLLLREPAA